MTRRRKAIVVSGCVVVLALTVIAFLPARRPQPDVKIHQCPVRHFHWDFFVKAATPIADNDFVELERGPCFGDCPAYTVTVRGDGAITWRGSSQVKAVGSATSQIPPSRACY